MQLLLNLLHQPHAPLLRVQFLRLLQPVGFILLHIENRQFQQLLLVAPLRHGEYDIIKFHVQFEGDDNFLRRTLVSLPHFDDAEREQFLFRFVQPLFIFKRECLVDDPVRDVQVIDKCRIRLLLFDRKHIHIVEHRTYHFRLRAVVLNQQILLLHLLCFLKFHLCCQGLHLFQQQAADLIRVPL